MPAHESGGKQFAESPSGNENVIIRHRTLGMALDRSSYSSTGVLNSFRKTLAKLQDQAVTDADRVVVTEFERLLAELEAKTGLADGESRVA